MKHALLILAHKDANHLQEIIRFFDEEFYVYIHIDKKSSITSEEHLTLCKMRNVRWMGSSYSINWGGHNVLKGVIELMKVAVEDGVADYYHLISGQDYPTKNKVEFEQFFQYRVGTEFLEYSALPYKRWPNGGFDRITKFYFYDQFNFKSVRGWKILNKLEKWQQKYQIRRKLPLNNYPTLYGGSCWCSLSKECVRYVVEETRKLPFLFKRLRFTFAPDEMYIQTLLLHSPFSKRIENDNLRYIVWEKRNGSFPSNLDETDYQKIITSNKLFARKIEYPRSLQLVKLLKEQNKNCMEKYKGETSDNQTSLPISIVMPMYNSALYLKECIDSIFNQSFQAFELIVVDDGSTDESLSILKSYSDPRIRIIENKHDYIDSFNKGLNAATGKYIARMDTDDRMVFERLSVQYEYMEHHPEVVVCGSWVKRFGTGYEEREGHYPNQHDEIASIIVRSTNPICHPTTFIRRSFLKEHDIMYSHKALYAEDLQLWIDIIKAGGRFYNLPNLLLEYRQQESQVTRTFTKQMFETSDRIYSDYLDYVMNMLGDKDEELWNIFCQMIGMVKKRAIPLTSLTSFVYEVYKNYLHKNTC